MLTCCWGSILKNGDVHVNFHEWLNSGVYLRKGLQYSINVFGTRSSLQNFDVDLKKKGVKVHARE